MMKNSWRRWGILVLMLTAVLIVGCGKKNNSANKSDTGFTVGDITVDIQESPISTVKFGRYMEVRSQVTNTGKDFSGMLQVIIPVSADKMMYRKTISVAQGETKNISIIIPVCVSGTNVMTLQLCDAEGKKLGQHKFNQRVTKEPTVNVGIVGKDTDDLGYLMQGNITTFYLKDGVPEDYRAMDSLDILLINNESTEEYTKNQIAAIQNFVDKGGTLLLGTGENGEKTLSAFSGTMLSGTVGKSSHIKTTLGITKEDLDNVREKAVDTAEAQRLNEVKNFLLDNLSTDFSASYSSEIEWLEDGAENLLMENGEIYTYLSKKFDEDVLKEKLNYKLSDEEKQTIRDGIVLKEMEKTVLQLKMENAQSVLEEGEHVLIQKIPYGQGNILVSGVDFGLDKDMWYSVGSVLASVCETNLSVAKRKQLDRESDGQQGVASDSLINALGLTENVDLPNTLLYALILLVYILLIGPVLYVVFKKKDIRQYLWGVIPACAVGFALMIYFIGMGTRLQKPKINYISVVEVNGGDNLDAVSRRNYFGVMVPDNKGTTMKLEGNADITPLIQEDYYYGYPYNRGQNNADYQYGIEYGTDSTMVLLDNMSTFSSVYLCQRDTVKVEGNVEGQISYKDFAIEGSVTNNTGKDIQGAMIYSDGFVYPLGDLPVGKSASVAGVKSVYMPTGLWQDRDNALRSLTGYSTWDQAPAESKKYKKYRQSHALESFFSTKTDFADGHCYVIGFVDDNSFVDTLDYDGSGMTIYCYELSLSMGDGTNTMISDISMYDVTNKNNDMYDGDRACYHDKITEKYAFDKDLDLQTIWYLGKSGDYSQWGYDIFDGKISILNQKTGEEEVIFKDGEAGEFDLTQDYVTDENEVVLTFEKKNNGDGWLVPMLKITGNQ